MASKIRRYKEETLVVPVPNGSGAGIPIILNRTLDKNFDRCVGLAVHCPTGFGANSTPDIGLADSNGTILDDRNFENLNASANVEPDKKFRTIGEEGDGILNDGRQIFARVTPPVLTVAAYTIQFVFKSERSSVVDSRL